jgi:uncharacterized protein
MSLLLLKTLQYKNMKNLSMVAWVLVIVGALNWGLVAMNMNLVSMLVGGTFLEGIVYALVGLSGLYLAYEKFVK